MHLEINQEANLNLTFIVGFMGSGKTTWGKKLARTTGYRFVDLDHLIVDAIRMDIPHFFKTQGESEFRRIEAETLRSISSKEPTIVATGGGTPCFHENMDWMNAHGKTMYFKLSPEQLWQRLNRPKHISSRPALNGLTGDELLAFITQKLEDREPYYAQALHIIDQANIRIEDLVPIVAPRPQNT